MRKTILTGALAFFIAFGTQAQEKFNLKIKLEKDKPINYEMLMKMDVQGPQDVMMDMSMDMTLKPIEVTPDLIKLEAKYTKVRMDMNAGMMMVTFDSSEEPKDEISKAIGAQIMPLLDASLKMTMDPYGKVLEVEAPNVAEGMFDENSLKSISLGFPNKDITIGESWETTSDSKLGGPITITNTLVEKTADGLKIETKGKILDAEGKEIGTQSGFYIIDSKTYLTKSMEASTNLEVQGQKVSSSMTLKMIN